MLKVSYIGGFNPFDWEFFHCPVCKGNEFVSVSHTGVFCDKCHAQFSVRSTCGDAGCVVDCYINPMPSGGDIFAPLWRCEECGEETALFEWQEQVCPSNIHTKLRRVEHISRKWNRPKNFPDYFYLILKLGDYCSGWIRGNDYEPLDYPTQEEWDKFQETSGKEKETNHGIYSRIVV